MAMAEHIERTKKTVVNLFKNKLFICLIKYYISGTVNLTGGVLLLHFNKSVMGYKSKITFFLIVFLITFSFTGCKKSKYDVIPDVYVDFTMDLNDPEFFTMNAIGNAVIITSSTNNWGTTAAGYGGNGIIVYRATMEDFYAYDCTCPYDFAVNGKSVKLKIDGIFAVCPSCGTTYALPAFGSPYSGVGKYPLKNYKTYFNGQYVHVWHSI